MSDSLITSAEAGRLIGKSTRTISRLAESGRLSYVRKLPGPVGHYLFDPDAVLKFGAEQQQKKAS
jgi:hypothetical protein